MLLAGGPAAAFLVVAGVDLVGPEAAAYGEQLRAVGVAVETKTYAGAMHMIPVLAGYVGEGRASRSSHGPKTRGY